MASIALLHWRASLAFATGFTLYFDIRGPSMAIRTVVRPRALSAAIKAVMAGLIVPAYAAPYLARSAVSLVTTTLSVFGIGPLLWWGNRRDVELPLGSLVLLTIGTSP